MEYIRDRKSTFSFSLHDSRIVQIESDEKKLSLKIDRIFQYDEDGKNGIREKLNSQRLIKRSVILWCLTLHMGIMT